jgi:hypothetical protein
MIVASALASLAGITKLIELTWEAFELANKVIANGGQVRRREKFSHPFMDSDEATATSRLKIAIEFLNSK